MREAHLLSAARAAATSFAALLVDAVASLRQVPNTSTSSSRAGTTSSTSIEARCANSEASSPHERSASTHPRRVPGLSKSLSTP